MSSINSSPRTAPPSPEGRFENDEYREIWKEIFCSKLTTRLRAILNNNDHPLPKWRSRAYLYRCAAELEPTWISPTPSTTETRSPNSIKSPPSSCFLNLRPQSRPQKLFPIASPVPIKDNPLCWELNALLDRLDSRKRKQNPTLSASHSVQQPRKHAKLSNAPQGITKSRLRQLPSRRRTHRMILRSTTMRKTKNGGTRS